MNSELIKITENKISDALNHRYNNQVPHSAECVTSRQLGKILRFPLKEEHTELQLKSDSEIDAQIFEYQLPQTRIFCTLIQTLELKIYLVTYFNKVIVIIDPRFTEGKQNIEVYLTTDTEFVAPPGLKAVNNNLYLISGIANFLFALKIKN